MADTPTNSPATSTAAPAQAASESAGATAAAPGAAPGAASASPDGGGAAPATHTQATDASAAAAAAASPAASEAPAADAAATEAQKSEPSLLEAAKAKLPDKAGETPAAPDAKPTDGTKEGEKPADGAKPATDAKPEADKKPADKPAEPKSDKKEGEAAPAKEALAEKPQARSYEAFKVPDGTKLDNKQVKSFTDVLEAADLGHQERGQKLIDMHVAEIQRVVKETTEHQRKVWTDYTNQLKDAYAKDPDLGGNRRDTTLGIAKFVVERFGGSEEQVADTLRMMTHTGMGNYVGLSRIFNNIYEAFLANPILPGNPPSRGSGRRTFQDVAYGDGPGGAAS